MGGRAICCRRVGAAIHSCTIPSCVTVSGNCVNVKYGLKWKEWSCYLGAMNDPLLPCKNVLHSNGHRVVFSSIDNCTTCSGTMLIKSESSGAVESPLILMHIQSWSCLTSKCSVRTLTLQFP